jgi:hypothetical protein
MSALTGTCCFSCTEVNPASLELGNSDMPTKEWEWLEKAGNLAAKTVLKAGEVLYILSHYYFEKVESMLEVASMRK